MWAVESMWCNKDRTSSKVRIVKLTESENQYRQYDVLLPRCLSRLGFLITKISSKLLNRRATATFIGRYKLKMIIQAHKVKIKNVSIPIKLF